MDLNTLIPSNSRFHIAAVVSINDAGYILCNPMNTSAQTHVDFLTQKWGASSGRYAAPVGSFKFFDALSRVVAASGFTRHSNQTGAAKAVCPIYLVFMCRNWRGRRTVSQIPADRAENKTDSVRRSLVGMHGSRDVGLGRSADQPNILRECVGVFE